MNNRIKNFCILAVLIIFLLIIYFIPVTCFFKQVTGISCAACGMTRAFIAIFNFDFYTAFSYNILSIPLFIFIIYTIFILSYEILKNQFNYIPKLLSILSNKFFLVLLFLFILLSFIINNLST